VQARTDPSFLVRLPVAGVFLALPHQVSAVAASARTMAMSIAKSAIFIDEDDEFNLSQSATPLET